MKRIKYIIIFALLICAVIEVVLGLILWSDYLSFGGFNCLLLLIFAPKIKWLKRLLV